MFRPFIQKMRKGFHVSTSTIPTVFNDVEFDEETNMSAAVPDDVAEGCFTVFAVQGKEEWRFIIELDNLKNPAFVSLLEQAHEEYGFQQKGALSLPRRRQELQKILADWKAEHADNGDWTNCNAVTVRGH